MSVNSGNSDQELSAVAATPEPGTLMLVGTGLVALAGTARSKLLR